MWWCIQKRTIWVRSKAEGLFWGWEVEEKDGELAVFGRVEEETDIAVRMEATGDAGAWRTLNAQALGTDGDAAIGADFGA